MLMFIEFDAVRYDKYIVTTTTMFARSKSDVILFSKCYNFYIFVLQYSIIYNYVSMVFRAMCSHTAYTIHTANTSTG